MSCIADAENINRKQTRSIVLPEDQRRLYRVERLSQQADSRHYAVLDAEAHAGMHVNLVSHNLGRLSPIACALMSVATRAGLSPDLAAICLVQLHGRTDEILLGTAHFSH